MLIDNKYYWLLNKLENEVRSTISFTNNNIELNKKLYLWLSLIEKEREEILDKEVVINDSRD